MRKNYFGRQLKRDANERKALFKGLVSQLVIHERVKTTEAKAKAIRGLAEKLVTKSRKEALLAHKLLQPYLTAEALKKMISDIGPRFVNRQGGYTRIVKLQNRFSDNADMAIIEWVEKGTAELIQPVKKTKIIDADVVESEAEVLKESKPKKTATKVAVKAKKVPAKKKGEKKV